MEQDILKEMKQTMEADLNPRAVAEWIHDRKNGIDTYNAEVAYRGQHYVVGKDYASRQEAIEYATAICGAMREEMHKAGFPFIKDYPVAKE